MTHARQSPNDVYEISRKLKQRYRWLIRMTNKYDIHQYLNLFAIKVIHLY